MSSDVWKIGENLDAADYYKLSFFKSPEGKFWGINGEVGAANAMTEICKEMIATYNEITDDQNEYLLEIDKFNEEIDKKVEEKNEKIKNHENRIKELERKDATGDLTEEEVEELKKENSELLILSSNGNSEVSTLCSDFNSKSEARQTNFKSKEKIAENYGNKAVEKGQELAKTHVSSGFFKKLFGSTGKSKKCAGENALKAGNELLDKVKESKDVDNEISKIVKHSTSRK